MQVRNKKKNFWLYTLPVQVVYMYMLRLWLLSVVYADRYRVFGHAAGVPEEFFSLGKPCGSYPQNVVRYVLPQYCTHAVYCIHVLCILCE